MNKNVILSAINSHILHEYYRIYHFESEVFRALQKDKPYKELKDVLDSTATECQDEIITMYKSRSRSIIRDTATDTRTLSSQPFTLDDIYECILDKNVANELRDTHETMLKQANAVRNYYK